MLRETEGEDAETTETGQKSNVRMQDVPESKKCEPSSCFTTSSAMVLVGSEAAVTRICTPFASWLVTSTVRVDAA
jgi:hypothetical protein